MIEISSTGGIAGLSAESAPKTSVRLDDLPTAEAAAVCEAFQPNALAAIAEAPASPGRTDTIIYEIVVTDQDGPHAFQIDETQLSAEVLDLIDDLIHGRD